MSNKIPSIRSSPFLGLENLVHQVFGYHDCQSMDHYRDSMCRGCPIITKGFYDCDLYGRRRDTMMAHLLVAIAIAEALNWV